MKRLLMICLLPITVCAAMPMCGSASATIENRKGIYIFSTEEYVVDGLTSTLDFDSESTELFTTPDYEADLIVDDGLMFTAEEQDLADTLLSDEVREE